MPDLADARWLASYAASEQVAAAAAAVRAVLPAEAWPAIERLMDSYAQLVLVAVQAALRESQRGE